MSRDIYPIELIKTSLYVVKFLNQKKVCRRIHEPVRSLILYLLEKQGDMWLPLNRDYKPIGLHGYNEHAKYEEYPFLLIPSEKINFTEFYHEQKNLNGNKAYYVFNDLTYPDNPKNKRRYIDMIQKIFFKNQQVIENFE